MFVCVCVRAELDTFAKSASELFEAQEKSSAKYANALFNTHQQCCVQKNKKKTSNCQLESYEKVITVAIRPFDGFRFKMKYRKKAALFIQ